VANVADVAAMTVDEIEVAGAVTPGMCRGDPLA